MDQERKNDAEDTDSIAGGEEVVLEERLPEMEDAAEEAERIKVIGVNHCRRTEKDRAEEEYLRRMRGGRSRPPPRFVKKYQQWRVRVDGNPRCNRKFRWFCIFFTCLVTGIMSMVGLWSLGELVAALAVMGTIMLLGVGACIAVEIAFWCPDAVLGMLYNTGFIAPYAGDGARLMEEYDVEIGPDYSVTFTSPDVIYEDEDDDDDEALEKPVYGEYAAQVHRPMEKVKRFVAYSAQTARRAWGPGPPIYDDGYEEDPEYPQDESDYEDELNALQEQDPAALLPEEGPSEPPGDVEKIG